jgi:programmed cell death 6-interacting protein
MPNQLALPSKKGYQENIKEAVRLYIQTHHTDVHPDAFKHDIAQWEKLRAECMTGGIHMSRVDAFLR